MFSPISIFGQKPLEVEAIVHSTTGGFKFPDNTIQTTAAAHKTGEEVSDQRGVVSAFYSSLQNVQSNKAFKVLGIDYVGTDNPYALSHVEIIHNFDEDGPDFLAAYYTNIIGHDITVTYLDQNDDLYLSQELGSCFIRELSHEIVPFSTDQFGHIIRMKHECITLAIKDEVGNYCKCYDYQLNSPNNCGC